MEVQANVTAGRLMAFASGKSGIFAADPRRRTFFRGLRPVGFVLPKQNGAINNNNM